MTDQTDKVVIVTGAGRGIGEGYAKHFAEHGMKVVVAELDEEGGQRVAAEIEASGGEALFAHTDVGDEASANACAAAAAERFGGVDYLVNNAAIFGGMRLDGYMNVDLDYLTRFMHINVHGAVIMSRAAVPLMKERGGGAIVNQSSTAAWMNMGFYGVAKLALNGITGSLARELGHCNIRVNAIAPGPTDTPALEQNAGDYVREMLKSMPIGRIGTPLDLARAVRFLLSDEASWITGHVLNVDGGQLMRP